MSKNFYMNKIGKKAKHASLQLSNINIDKRNSVLKLFSQYIKTNSRLILSLNEKDILNAKAKKIKSSIIDRLKLDNKKITQIIKSINEIVKFNDPLGKTLSSIHTAATPASSYFFTIWDTLAGPPKPVSQSAITGN